MIKNPLILAIDTSCDETSCSIVRGLNVLSNVLPSQQIHKKHGGVVPSLARLAHMQRIDSVVEEALKKARVKISEIDAIAVTIGPGLAIALEVGIKKAKELSFEYNKPLLAINHMQGHLYSSFAQRNSSKSTQVDLKKQKFPVLGFLISGGHTEIILLNSFFEYQKIGQTLDDSCGEAFDKCGRMLGLGYPAGPVVSEFAQKHRKNMTLEIRKSNLSTLCVSTNKSSGQVYELPIPMAHSKDLNLSFSGLKTAFAQLVNSLTEEEIHISQKLVDTGLKKTQIMDLCVAFEYAAIEQLKIKLEKAILEYQPKEVWLGGGVVASSRLRSELRKICLRSNIQLKYPYSTKLTTDNAAMIAIAASLKIQTQLPTLKHNPKVGVFTKEYEFLDRQPSLSL